MLATLAPAAASPDHRWPHRQQANAAYMADAKMRSVLLRIQEDNAIRATLGYPPLEFESSQVRGRSPSRWPA